MDEMLKNSQAALAALAAVLAVGGLLLTLGGYISFFLFIGSLDSSISPQIDSASAAVGGMRIILSSAEESSSSASIGLGEISGALAAYSESANGMGDSLAGVAAVPPFSLDGRLSASAAKLKEASSLFASASGSLNSSAGSILNATQSLKETSDDLGKAASSLEAAKEGFKGALSMLHLAALASALALLSLFSSVLLLSASILLQHYQRLFKKKDSDEDAEGDGEAGKE